MHSHVESGLVEEDQSPVLEDMTSGPDRSRGFRMFFSGARHREGSK